MKRQDRKRYVLSGWLSCGMVELPVLSVSLWQSAQPVLLKMFLPFAIDCGPPGSLSDGCGGASKRMKLANFSMSLSKLYVPTLVGSRKIVEA